MKEALTKEQKQSIKRKANQLAQKQVKEIKLSIEWKKSKMYGHNPHATAQVFHVDGSISNFTAKCSGYGYDKESTVFADIFNQCLAYHLHTSFKSIKAPYGVSLSNPNWLYYAGGVGVSCYYDIVASLSGKMDKMGWGNNFDVYNIKFIL